VRAPNGIALSDDGRVLYIADLFGVIAVDRRNGTAQDVDPGRGNTRAGIDGLYWYRDGFVAVQYGAEVRRVTRVHMSKDRLRVVARETLEQRTPLVSFPTTGAIVGDRFYYIANTGIGNLDDDRIVDPTKLEPVHIAVVRLDSSSRAPRRIRPINAPPSVRRR
jgi:sugar lactone lactonase YvrE